jgi:SET domain-containing protein
MKMKLKPNVKIARSKIHGTGLFATVDFKKGDHIGTFSGRPTQEDGIHVLWYQKGRKWHGIEVDCILKYANHSKKPNTQVVNLDMFALRFIPKGEEITFDYGDEWA